MILGLPDYRITGLQDYWITRFVCGSSEFGKDEEKRLKNEEHPIILGHKPGRKRAEASEDMICLFEHPEPRFFSYCHPQDIY